MRIGSSSLRVDHERPVVCDVVLGGVRIVEDERVGVAGKDATLPLSYRAPPDISDIDSVDSWAPDDETRNLIVTLANADIPCTGTKIQRGLGQCREVDTHDGLGTYRLHPCGPMRRAPS